MSEHTVISSEHSHAHGHNEGTGRIWKVFWLLSFITLIELAIGLFLYFKSENGGGPGLGDSVVLTAKIIIGILTILKAYYIVAVFMHLGDEVKNMIMTITVPLVLFVWFIIAFLIDGNSWKNMRNTNAGSRPSIENTENAKPTPAVKEGVKP
jgi:cytochrome c oxidase subunit IV